ncbi:hypothetical protein ACJX0J_010973, partial [Zea mays]
MLVSSHIIIFFMFSIHLDLLYFLYGIKKYKPFNTNVYGGGTLTGLSFRSLLDIA